MATGRPTRLDQTHEYDPTTGRPITIATAIARYIRQGNYLETACHLTDVSPAIVRQWLREGARIHEQRLAGYSRRRLSKRQRLEEAFSLDVRRAMAEAEARDVNAVARLALGGIPQQVITEKVVARVDDAGNTIRDPDTGEIVYDVIERSVRTSRTLPDLRALQWRLERRFPDRWGRYDRVEVDLHAVGDDDLAGIDPVDEFQGALEQIFRRKTEALAQLEEAGALDVIDVDVLDETSPGERPTDPGDQL